MKSTYLQQKNVNYNFRKNVEFFFIFGILWKNVLNFKRINIKNFKIIFSYEFGFIPRIRVNIKLWNKHDVNAPKEYLFYTFNWLAQKIQGI